MSADNHLSPNQFGFPKVKKREWLDALDAGDNGAYEGTNAFDGYKRVPTSTVSHTAQPRLYPEGVEKYKSNPRIGGVQAFEGPINLVKHQGKVYQGEGHHRMAAARARGQKTIKVWWTDTGQ